MMEKNSENDLTVQPDKPGKIEHYEKRFGVIAVEKGFINADELVKALTIQVEEDLRGIPHRLLGKILFDMGLMTDRQIEEVLSHIFRKVP